MDPIETVRACYDSSAATEWLRLQRHMVEFEINKRYMEKYIHKGDSVLDIGGGPGRYSLHLAKIGCHATLFDLAQQNIAFAKEKAAEMGITMETVCGDARYADTLVSGTFDAVLLMGPLYHLKEEKDRVMAMRAALNLLKPGGILFASFISSYAAVWDYLARHPDMILDESERKYFDLMEKDQSFSGFSFTETHFIRPGDIRPFMASFPLRQLHFLGSESILSLKEQDLIGRPPEVLAAWIDFAEKVCERQEFLSMAEHFLYIGKKL